MARLSKQLQHLDSIEADLSFLETLVDEHDAISPEEMDGLLGELAGKVKELSDKSLFGFRYADSDALCRINAGAGGAEAQAWVKMLWEMYSKWGAEAGYTVELDAVSEGDNGGYASVDFRVCGEYAYGWMLSEQGVHRLSRKSPFGKVTKRHTSFASVEVVPSMSDPLPEGYWDEGDVRIDTYRASGAGGQHRNVTDSAVRATHTPTGLVARSHNDRSQHHNKKQALATLKAKLAARYHAGQNRKLTELKGEKLSVSFGLQNRSYVLDPYTLVIDRRTGHQSHDAFAVLDGELKPFMQAWLVQKQRLTIQLR